MLVDSHCHLDFPELAGQVDAVVARAQEAGIGLMVTISTSLKQVGTVLAIAERFPDVYCSVGVHPHEAEAEADATAEHLVRLARHPKVVGIGETGLDFHYEHSPRAVQERLFRAHIAAARTTGLPVIVHSRNADAETAAILADEMGQGAFSGLIHCFTSGPELRDAALNLGLFISLSGIVTFKNADALRQTVRAVPLGRLLLETDAPFLAPVPKRGKPNEPSFLAHTAAYVADMLAIMPAELAARTTENVFSLFRKIPPISEGVQGHGG